MEKNGLTLVREKGKDLPPLVVESALLNFGASVAVAYAHAEGGVPGIEILQQNLKDVDHAGGALGFVNDLLEMTKEHKIVLHFSSSAKDIQPFSFLVDDKGKPSLVGFLVGDFSEYPDDKDHTLEYVAAMEDLGPKFELFFEKADDDVPKLMTKLKEPNITRDLSKLGAGDFLNLTLLASNGEMLGYCRPKSPPIKHDWGSASGEYEAKAEPAKAAEPVAKTLSLAERMAAKKAATKGEGDGGTPTTPKKEEPELPPGQHRIKEPAVGKPMESLADRMKAKKEAKGTSGADTSGDAKPALHVVGIPLVFDKVKNRRKWFAQRGPTGETNVDFPDWQTRTSPILVPLFKLQAVHGKQTVEELTKKFPIATAEEIKLYSGSTVALEKKTEPAKEPVTSTKIDPTIIDAAQKANIRERLLAKPHIVALVDKKGQSVMDPTFLPAMEDRAPLWTESLGLPNIHAADWWKSAQFAELGSYSLAAVATAAAQYKLLWLKEEKKVFDLQAELAKLKGEPLPGSSTGVVGAETKPGLSLAERLAAKKKAAA